MPTYTVTIPAGRVTDPQKQRVAAAITKAHHDATGAPMFFAQVLFSDVAQSNHFLGGEPLEGDQIFVHGQIRAGRSGNVKHMLLMRIVADVSAALDIPAGRIWVYISELPPSLMVEFCRVLPEPGGEAAWTDAMAPSDRDRLEKLGRAIN